jgi:hypothetical protein
MNQQNNTEPTNQQPMIEDLQVSDAQQNNVKGGPSGDYNSNGHIDARDYLVWH